MDAHHFTVGVFAQPGSQFNGAHEDEKQTQGERKRDERYGPGRGHLCSLTGTGRLGKKWLRIARFPREDAPGGWAWGGTTNMARLRPASRRDAALFMFLTNQT